MNLCLQQLLIQIIPVYKAVQNQVNVAFINKNNQFLHLL